jgi:SAM-dependent methyltransferase
MTSKFSYAITIFLGAFLLFEVQPLIAKIILPWFGGAASVWIMCLLFFQFVLLLGYAYAHWLTLKLRAVMQARVHMALLAVSLLTLPIYPRVFWKPTSPDSPALHILLLLAATVGLPYFVLSATGPLLQRWYGRQSGGAPYAFYSLSNIGSMLALISYPVVVEPRVATRNQAMLWSAVYGVFAAICAAVALKAGQEVEEAKEREEVEENRDEVVAPEWQLQLLWVALAGCGSALLLSVTNHISQNVASVPFLWVVPLGLYLFSFILCFASYSLYSRGLFLRLLGIALGGMTYALSPAFSGLPPKVALPMFCGGLFVACMFCHGELARLRPDPQHLTSFYLMISLGGAIGSLLVAVVAPHVFTGFYELHVALGACAVLVVVVHARDPESPFSVRRLRPGGLVLAGLAVALIAGLGNDVKEDSQHARFAERNFYGVVRVVDGPPVKSADEKDDPAPRPEDMVRSLMNGTINHGTEFLATDRQRTPTTYYGAQSGIATAIQAAGKTGPLRVGVIGLGAGTTALYGRAGDRFTYYEINPLVIEVAKEQFSFLKNSAATIDIVEGDARLSLDSEPAQGFDVLAVDAFTGDSIPVHLLTREAFQLYFRQLKPQGVLAVHVSNQFLDLRPVIAAAAATMGKEAVLIHNGDDHPNGIYASNWMIVGDTKEFEGQGDVEGAGVIILPATKTRLWTDDFSNLFEAVK